MFKRIAAVLLTVLLTACATQTQVTDFADRSLGYGWLDIHELDANRLYSVEISPAGTSAAHSYYPAAVKRLGDGYLFYTLALRNGTYKIGNVYGQRCLGILCTGTTYRYIFGGEGDEVGAIAVTAPGVYPIGAYKLVKLKTGIFEPGKFDAEPATHAPSRREMLEAILKDTQDVPLVAGRIKRELAHLR